MPVVLFFLLIGFLPLPALAIMPPDLIISVGSSLVQLFSIIAIVAGGLFSTIILSVRRFFVLSARQIWLMIGGVILFMVSIIGVVFIIETHQERTTLLTYVSDLELTQANLQIQLKNSVSQADYWRALESVSQNPTEISDWMNSASSSDLASVGQRFFSDNIVLYGGTTDKPFVIEIDFNRLEKGANIFTHYTSLYGNIDGVAVSEEGSLNGVSNTLRTNHFVTSIEKVRAPDLSSRDTYRGTILVDNEPLTFVIDDLKVDFISRHLPEYTQYQSVGSARVTFRGQTFITQALAEVVLSTDSTKYIFFPGRDKVEAETHQFILWDEQKNFYLIDQSEVRSNTSAYPSHTWLLHKNSAGWVKKSFSAQINTEVDSQGKVSWHLETTDFNQAVIDVRPTFPFRQAGDNRVRTIVSGTVKDSQGERKIGGILHLIK